MRAHALVAVALVSTAQLGCYAPALRDCELRCSTGGSCPDGLTCTGGVCRDPNATETCSLQQVDAPGADTLIDTPMAAEWTVPIEVQGIGVGYQDPSLKGDMSLMYLSRNNEIFASTFNPASMQWTAPQVVSEISAVGAYTSPFISFDGQVLHLTHVSGGSADIWRCVRPNGQPQFQGLNPLAELNSTLNDSGGAMQADATLLAMTSNRTDPNQVDLYQSSWNPTTQAWRPPVPMAALNDPAANDGHPVFDATGLRVVFSSDRTGNYDLYTSTRANVVSAFDPPQPISDVNTPVQEGDPWLSPDGKTLYFVRGAPAISRVMMSRRLP